MGSTQISLVKFEHLNGTTFRTESLSCLTLSTFRCPFPCLQRLEVPTEHCGHKPHNRTSSGLSAGYSPNCF